MSSCSTDFTSNGKLPAIPEMEKRPEKLMRDPPGKVEIILMKYAASMLSPKLASIVELALDVS